MKKNQKFSYKNGECVEDTNGEYRTEYDCEKEALIKCRSKFECLDDETWKKCYRRNALVLHPDKGGDSEKFKELNNCNSTVKDL